MRGPSVRGAPLDDPHSIKDAYLDSTVSTASKRNEEWRPYRVLRPSGGEKCAPAAMEEIAALARKRNISSQR